MKHSFDDKSDAWLEGYQGNKIGDHTNWYEAGTQKHKEWQEGHDWSANAPALTLERVATITKPGEEPACSRFGYVIAEDGTVYALNYRYYHGIICAILYPELAKVHESGIPVEPHDENRVMTFQRFEHDNANNMRVIRISFAQLMSNTYFSKGKYKATPQQIQSTLAVCKVLGFKGRDVITTEYGDETVAKIIERLHEGADFAGAQS